MRFPGQIALVAIVTLLFGLSVGVPARADQVVYFVNGKAITAKKVEKGDRLTVLEIEGGGRIGVPTAQIDRIEELQISAPGPAVALAAPAPAQPAPTPTQVMPAGQPAAVAATASGPVTGPGVGGKPVLPAGSLTGLKPLTLGGEDADGPPTAKVAVPAHPGTQPPGAQTPGPMVGLGPTGQTMRTDGGLMAGPGAAARRFNARGGPFGRVRPAGGAYFVPPAQGAPGQTAAAQGQAGAKPPATQQPGAQSPQPPAAQPPAAQPPPQQPPAAQTPPPPPPPIQDPPPPPDDQGTADSPSSPPPDDPGTSDPPPADDNPPGGQT